MNAALRALAAEKWPIPAGVELQLIGGQLRAVIVETPDEANPYRVTVTK